MARVTRRRFLMGATAAVAVAPPFSVVARAQAVVKIGTAVLGDYGLAKRLGWTPEAVLLPHTKITGSLFSDEGRFDVEALRTMQDTLLEEKVLSMRLPLEQHYTADFTPVRV